MGGEHRGAGEIIIRRDPLPMTHRIELSAGLAAALGDPAAVVPVLVGDTLTVVPGDILARGTRLTWRTRTGSMVFAAPTRVLALCGQHLGRWPARVDAGRVLVDLAGAGDDRGRPESNASIDAFTQPGAAAAAGHEEREGDP